MIPIPTIPPNIEGNSLINAINDRLRRIAALAGAGTPGAPGAPGAPGGGGGTGGPAPGDDTQIIYNGKGLFAASPLFVFDDKLGNVRLKGAPNTGFFAPIFKAVTVFNSQSDLATAPATTAAFQTSGGNFIVFGSGDVQGQTFKATTVFNSDSDLATDPTTTAAFQTSGGGFMVFGSGAVEGQTFRATTVFNSLADLDLVPAQAHAFQTSGGNFIVFGDGLIQGQKLKLTTPLAPIYGGTGISTIGTNTQVLIGGTPYSWGKVDLATMVTGSLSGANIVAPGVDRQVIFNKGGPFGTATNFEYNYSTGFSVLRVGAAGAASAQNGIQANTFSAFATSGAAFTNTGGNFIVNADGSAVFTSLILSVTPLAPVYGGTGISAIGTNTQVLIGGTPYSWGQVNLATMVTGSLPASAITAPGATTQVIFNDAGLFAANAGFTFTKGTNSIAVAGAITAGAQVTATGSLIVTGATATNRSLYWQTGGANRWAILTDAAAESGGDAGSNLLFYRAHDSGSLYDPVISITRTTGDVSLFHGLSVAANAVVSGSAAIGGAITPAKLTVGDGSSAMNGIVLLKLNGWAGLYQRWDSGITGRTNWGIAREYVAGGDFGLLRSSAANGTPDTTALYFNTAGNMSLGGLTSPGSLLHLYGPCPVSPPSTASPGGALLLDDSIAQSGSGGMIIFGAGNSWRFAAIRGYATDGTPNTMGDLVFYTRRATANTTLTETMRLSAAGSMSVNGVINSTTGGIKYPDGTIQTTASSGSLTLPLSPANGGTGITSIGQLGQVLLGGSPYSWGTISASGITAPGLNTYITFNSNGGFGASANFTFDPSFNQLTVAGIIRSTSGGFRFPDGTTQTTAAAGVTVPGNSGCMIFNFNATFSADINFTYVNSQLLISNPGSSMSADNFIARASSGVVFRTSGGLGISANGDGSFFNVGLSGNLTISGAVNSSNAASFGTLSSSGSCACTSFFICQNRNGAFFSFQDLQGNTHTVVGGILVS